jgi:predicted transcriptional regulator
MKDILNLIGLDGKQSEIYLKLLSFGSSPASKIATELGYDRTTTYYILMQMLEKGFVSQTIRGRVKHFTAVEPKQIQSLLKEREQMFSEVLPNLMKLTEGQDKGLSVEIRQGKEGLHHLYRDAILTGGELLALGVDDAQYMDLDPIHFKQYNKEVERGKIKERLLTVKGAKVFGSKVSKYRFIPKEYFSPTPIIIYGNKVVIITWKPSVHLIYIDSKDLAKSFRRHFELLWKIAETRA